MRSKKREDDKKKKNGWRERERRGKLNLKPDDKPNEKSLNAKRNVELRLGKSNRTKEDNGKKILPERDQSEKRLSLSAKKDNDWKSKRNKRRLNVEPTKKLRERTQRRHERRRSESIEPRKKRLKESSTRYNMQRRLVEPARPEPVSNAIDGNVRRWFVSGEGYMTPEDFLNSVRDGVKEVVDGVVGPKKVYTVLKCVLVRHDLKTGDRVFSDFNGHSKTHTVTAELGETYEEMKDKMLESLAKYQKEGSDWQLYSVKGLDISVVRFNPLNGSGYSKLPPLIAKKKAVINMKNNDDQCFKWAVTRALNSVKRDSERITKELRKQAEVFNWDGITFPTKVKDIPIWERNNDKFVSVFGYDDESKKIYTIKMCDDLTSVVLDEEQDKKFINLFLHDDNHYCVVKNLSRLLSSQHSKHKEKRHFCLRCHNGFNTSESLKVHQEMCLKHKTQTIIYANPGDTEKFRNYERLHDVPFVVYADFECFVKPLETKDKDPSKSYTVKYQSHIPSGFCYTIKCVEETVCPTKTVLRTASYEGEDMGRLFVETLIEDLKPIYEILKTPKPMVMSDQEKDQYAKTKNCYACETQFGTERKNERTKKKEKVVKCRDHCHITGKYRGAACDKCNLRMRVPMFVPVLFHNLEDYDAHLFVKSLGLEEGEIKCIPKTDEKYISFSKNIPMETVVLSDGKERTEHLEMRFLDSF